MKNFLWAFLLTLSSLAGALPAFPGAEGWGADATGGRGGRVFVVTTLAPSGAGSLRSALALTGPKIIVFRVSGVIDVVNTIQLTQAHSNMTIAGQTSPGGITLRSSGNNTRMFMCYNANMTNQIYRFLRFRAGSHNVDAISYNVTDHLVFDHCDFSGAADETFDITNSHHFTVQWCSIANSSVCSGCQTYGALIAYPPTSFISLHHNLIAHHVFRAPEMHWTYGGNIVDDGMIDYRNNVVYNMGNSFMYISPSIALQGPLHMNVVSNYFKAGPNTTANGPMSIASTADVYQTDNVWDRTSGTSTPSGGVPASSAFTMPTVTTAGAQTAYTNVLDRVGAWPRDPMVTRTVQEVKARNGTHGKTDDALIQSGPAAPADADMDGMPDYWETAMGLNVSDSSDSRGDKDGDGYTNIEEYINDLALVMTGQSPQNPVALEAAGAPAAAFAVIPSIYTGSGAIEFRLPEGRQTKKIEVVDLRGAVRKDIPASGRTVWDGRDRTGQILPSGLYIIRISDPRGALIGARRFMVTR